MPVSDRAGVHVGRQSSLEPDQPGGVDASGEGGGIHQRLSLAKLGIAIAATAGRHVAIAVADHAVNGDDGLGAVVNSSRGIIFAYMKDPFKDEYKPEQFADASRAAAITMRDDIAEALKKVDKWNF